MLKFRDYSLRSPRFSIGSKFFIKNVFILQCALKFISRTDVASVGNEGKITRKYRPLTISNDINRM